VLTPAPDRGLGAPRPSRTDRQIGATLFISEKTASVHVSNSLAKALRERAHGT